MGFPARGTAIAAGILATLALAPPASAQIPSGNLLANPGAEDDLGAASETQTPCPSLWSCADDVPDATSSGPASVRYGTTTFPSLSESARIDGGKNFFSGGRAATSSIRQVPLASPLSLEGARLTLSGCFGGWQTDGDNARAEIQLSEDALPPQAFATQPVTAADRGNETKLLPRSVSVDVPFNTDSINVFVRFERVNGVYSDGYADNLSLTAGEGPTDPPAVDCDSSLPGGGDPDDPDDPGDPGDPGGGDPEPPAELERTLGFARKATVRTKRAQVVTKLSCNTDRVAVCESTASATLVKTGRRRAAKPIAVGAFAVPALGTAKAKLDLTAKGAKKLAKLSGKQLAKRALELSATTELGAQDATDSATLALKRKR